MNERPPVYLDYNPLRASGAVRLSVGGVTTQDDVDRAAAGLIAAWRRCRREA